MDLRIVMLLALGWMGSLGLAGGAAYHYGGVHERNARAALDLKTINAAVAASRIAAETESAAALAFSKAQAQRRLAAREKQLTLEKELARDEAARTCRIADATLGVLNDAIDSANAAAPAAGRSDGPSP